MKISHKWNRISQLAFAGFTVALLADPTAFAVTLVEAPPDAWSAHSYGLSYTAEYFASNSNYNYSRGSYTNLVNNNTWASYESHLRGRYNLNQSFSFYGGAGFSSVKAVDAGVTKTSTNATDIFAGIDYVLMKKYVHVIPELQVGFPVDSVSTTQTNPLTSDGTAYVQGGIFAYLPAHRFRFGSFAGVHAPVQNLATRFLYEVTMDVRVFSIITAGIGIDGYETLLSDSSNYAARVATAISADAGSERFYAYNPALIEGRAWIGVRPSKSFWARIGFGQSVNGMDMAQGQSITLSIQYNSPIDSRHQMDFRASPDKAVKEFRPEVESTDQELFEDQDAATRGAPARKRSQPNSSPSTEKSLDQTEKMLEQKNHQDQN